MAQLVDLLWDDDPPASAVKQVRNTVSSLRSLIAGLGAEIERTSTGYRIDVPAREVDREVFLDLVRDARALRSAGATYEATESYGRALSLWRGPAVLPIAGRLAQSTLSAHNEHRLVVLEEWADLQLSTGGNAEVSEALFEVVAANPLRERLAAQLIGALYLSGARARAFEIYFTTARLLRAELGLAPGQELQALHRRMLDGSLSARRFERTAVASSWPA